MSNSILKPLGIHGWESVENILLGCILLGEPILMVSQPGAAKTFFGEVLSKALTSPEAPCKYGYYDTSKTNFEDFIGFPNPESFRQGKAEFIHNELTIWDKNVIMLDEISRASRDTSNKWLEVLGSRMLMGKPLPLVAVLGAMNPVDHHATHLLDQAFADRFVAFVPLPEFNAMEENTQKNILSGQTGLDAPSLKFWETREIETHQYVEETQEFSDGAKKLRELLTNCAQKYREIDQTLVKSVEAYVLELQKALSTADLFLEARRLKMIKRVVLASYVIASQREDTNIADVCENVIPMLFPQPFTGTKLDKSHIRAAHYSALSALSNDEKDPKQKLLSKNHAERFFNILSGNSDGVSEKWTLSIVERVVSDLESDNSSEAYMTAMVLLSLLSSNQATKALAPSIWSRIALKAKIESKAMQPKSDQDEFLSTLGSNDPLKKFAITYCSNKATEKDDWKTIFQTALKQAHDAKETLQPLYTQWQK